MMAELIVKEEEEEGGGGGGGGKGEIGKDDKLAVPATLSRKKKRKERKKMKRKQVRREMAEKEKEEEEVKLNDLEEQRRVKEMEEEERQRMERKRMEFEERERKWLEDMEKKREEEEEEERRKALEEEEEAKRLHTTNVTYAFHIDHITPKETKEISVNTSAKDPVIPVIDHLGLAEAATKFQSAYRAHIIQTLYKKISSANSEADQLQRHIQRKETVDAIRSDDREKLRINETLMSLLLRLDSVPGVDPTVREARRKVSCRIVGHQEIIDGICGGDGGGGCGGGFLWDWDEGVAELETEVCRERGGEEMERLC